VSMDHVMQTAKHIKGDGCGMLIVCGAAGNVLDWWVVNSTSLHDVADDLRALAQRQQEKVLLVTVDDPKSMESVLAQVFPDAEIKMDVGHVIFSRLGKLLQKTHTHYREFIFDMCMC
jgi:hypothetical protein